MSETKYETLTLGQALDAVANGEEIEFSAIGSTLSWYCLAKDNTWTARQSKEYTFRRLIKAKKKLVPFTQETWPIGSWVKYQEAIVLVSCLSNGCAYLPYLGWFPYEKLLQDAKLLVIENGRVVGEKPCGMEVEE